MDDETKYAGLGDRMKSYEIDERVPPYKPYVCRLDGKNFSKFTKGLKKPFDPMFTRAMVRTMNDIVVKFNAATGFCCSDEITLIFSRCCTKDEFDAEEDKNKYTHFYGGRKTKINTILASFCSVRFNSNMYTELLSSDSQDDYSESFVGKVATMGAIFDSRLLEFPLDKDVEVINHLIWRSVYDCHRNTVSTYGRQYLKDTHKKDCKQMIQEMEEKGVSWNTVPMMFRYGIYAKKSLVKLSSEVNGSVVEYQRTKLKNYCFKVDSNEKMLEFALSKYMVSDIGFPYEDVTEEMFGKPYY